MTIASPKPTWERWAVDLNWGPIAKNMLNVEIDRNLVSVIIWAFPVLFWRMQQEGKTWGNMDGGSEKEMEKLEITYPVVLKKKYLANEEPWSRTRTVGVKLDNYDHGLVIYIMTNVWTL